MERSRRLRALWNWLPAFRAVAETEHLPTASEALLISPASLSRTIGLLEDELGILLFDRVGRGLRLNRQGAILLDAVRDGMRVIDEGVSGVEGQSFSGHVTLWAARCYAGTVLLPLAKKLQSQHPDLVPIIQSRQASEVAKRILRGQIDLAIVETPLVHEQLRTLEVRSVRYGIYCPKSHPLAGASSVDLAKLAADETFAVPALADDQGLVDHWPAQHHRAHAILVEDLNMALDACLQLGLLAVLPEVIAETAEESLYRLPTEYMRARLYACFRKPVGKHPRVDAMLEILAATVAVQACDETD